MKFLERFWFGCGDCHGGHGCPLAESVNQDRKEGGASAHGPALIGVAVLVFLVPMATAIIGAYVAGRWFAGPAETSLGFWQPAGAFVGFFAGVGLAKLVLWMCRRFLPVDGGVE